MTNHTETFDLFSQELPSQNLGFIDSKSHVLEITVAAHDLTIHQSPAILSSDRAGGTTGAGKSIDACCPHLFLLDSYAKQQG
jgi:hypothetical protein